MCYDRFFSLIGPAVRSLGVMLLLAALLSGCGYLDEDIHLSDDHFEESLTMSGVGTGGGSYGWGCGGVHLLGHYTRGTTQQDDAPSEQMSSEQMSSQRIPSSRAQGAPSKREREDSSRPESVHDNHIQIAQIAAHHAH